MGMATMQTIDTDTERDLIEGAGHGLGCWEIFAEQAVESGRAATGRHDDEVGGTTLWLAYLDAIEGGMCHLADGCPAGE